MSWRRYTVLVVGQAIVLAALLWGAILAIDPYDILPFSLPLKRGAVHDIHRFMHTGLTRRHDYDSAIVGTSVARTFRPAILGRRLGGRFVNIGLGGANPREQAAMLKLFLGRRGPVRVVLFEVSQFLWCDTRQRAARRKLRYEVPAWFYDDDPWNDILPHFNLMTVEHAGRQLGYALGLRWPRTGFDGFRDRRRDRLPGVESVRRRFRREGWARRRAGTPNPVAVSAAERAGWRFTDHVILKEMLDAVPGTALKIVVFPPLHLLAQPRPGSRRAAVVAECKRRITAIAMGSTPAGSARVRVLDFLIDSAITRRMANYLDRAHLRPGAADRVVELIALGVRQRRGVADAFRYVAGRGRLGPRDRDR